MDFRDRDTDKGVTRARELLTLTASQRVCDTKKFAGVLPAILQRGQAVAFVLLLFIRKRRESVKINHASEIGRMPWHKEIYGHAARCFAV